SGNPSAPRTLFPPISSPTKPRVMRSERSSTRSGGTPSAPVFVGAPSHSRSSSLTSGRSREAAPVRRRSRPEANSNSSATHCSNLSFLSRKAFGSSVSHYLHWRRRGLEVSEQRDSPADVSLGPFAVEVGSPRLLKLFARLGLKTTWFIPGHSIDTFPTEMKA